MSVKISRKAYAKKYGPTNGDRIRLADTELIIEIEQRLRRLRRGVDLRRRQVDPRRPGPVPARRADESPDTAIW